MFSLLPWVDLTRAGTEIPAFRVVRRPISTQGVTVNVGDDLPADLFPLRVRNERLRAFYALGRIEPVTLPARIPAVIQKLADARRMGKKVEAGASEGSATVADPARVVPKQPKSKPVLASPSRFATGGR
jgi:hypothetical protein